MKFINDVVIANQEGSGMLIKRIFSAFLLAKNSGLEKWDQFLLGTVTFILYTFSRQNIKTLHNHMLLKKYSIRVCEGRVLAASYEN